MYPFKPNSLEFSDEFKKQFREDVTTLKNRSLDFITYGADNFIGIAIAATILIGGLWLAVTTSTGG